MKNKKSQIFIIEHLEPDLWKWCIIEYRNISKIVGKNNLWFTNIKRNSKKLMAYGRVIKESVKELHLTNYCILDPEAKKTLKNSEAKKFDYFIFGGILGDYPPKKRTYKELSRFMKKKEKRNIGKAQMATDNAVFVVRDIIKGKRLEDIQFQDCINIKINHIESTQLPFRYVVINKKPLISQSIISYLKKKKDF